MSFEAVLLYDDHPQCAVPVPQQPHVQAVLPSLPAQPVHEVSVNEAMSHPARSLLARGLRCQVDAEFEAARGLYRAALVEAPADPEILHMLAVADYCLHDLDAADLHLRQAKATASGQELDAIIRTSRFIEAAAECRRLRHLVLDPAIDPPPPSAGPDTIHILQTYFNPSGGSEWPAIHLGERLARHRDVRYWTESPQPSPVFEPWKPQRIDTSNGSFPKSGTLVIVGCFFPIGAWLAETRLRRVILHYNVLNPKHLAHTLSQLAYPNLPKIEIVYASDLMRRNAGLPGSFEPSPIDLALLQPATKVISDAADFTVGRMSRDDRVKFDRSAAEFFRALAASGARVRIMGGTLLSDALANVANIELLPARAEGLRDFLRSLDCFTYRTHSSWTEAWGRVVCEAMGVGVPVVVHANGGCAQIIRHGENGFVFHRDREALDLIATLRNDPALRSKVGAAARRTAIELLGEEGFARHLELYLR